MRRLIRLAARLYPSWWRRRYAREFEALLEDLYPGWRELVDVMNGAVTMQIRTLRTIPALGALVGALVGGLVAMQIPALYASSGTIRLNARGTGNAESTIGPEIRASLEKALDGSNERSAATLATLRSDSAGTIVTVTYKDRDPVQAQRVAEQLTAAVVSSSAARARSSEVLGAPALPTSTVQPDYPTTIASGSATGLLAGGVVALFLRLRRRPARAD